MINENDTLTHREQQIAKKVALGLPNKLIANDLFISERTVKFHCANIYRKLSLRNRHALIAHYYSELTNRGYEPFNLSGGAAAIAEPSPQQGGLNS